MNTTSRTSSPGIAPKVDPTVHFYIRDANAAVMRAMAVFEEELALHGCLQVDASAIAKVNELAAVAATFAQMLSNSAAASPLS